MTEKEKKLAEDNIELAYYIAHRWHKYSRIELDEAISCAQLGLVKAAMKFDAEKGCRFATYAYKIMENEIRMELRKRNRRREEIYFEDPIEGTDGLVLGDMIADHRDCFEALEAEDEMIRNISLLTERERTAVMIRLQCPEKSQAECGRMMGISQSLFSRRLAEAKGKILAG